MDNSTRRERQVLESEYRTWAQICLDKHGQPWPISADELSQVSDNDLARTLKELKTLGRTPHE